MLITVVRCCRLWCCLLRIRNDCKRFLVIFSPSLSVSLSTRCHILPSTSISLSSFIALTGRPGSRVFPHQQYPCWCHPKGETTGKTISSLSVYTTVMLSAHATQNIVPCSHRDTPGQTWGDCHVRHVTHALIN